MDITEQNSLHFVFYSEVRSINFRSQHLITQLDNQHSVTVLIVERPLLTIRG